MTALQASGGRKSYGGVRALRGVDFELRAGEIHGLVGENGLAADRLATSAVLIAAISLERLQTPT